MTDSNDNSLFEEIEQAALKIALADAEADLIAGKHPSTDLLIDQAMRRAVEWHSEKIKQLKEFYTDPTNRQDWIKNPHSKVTMQDIENANLRLINEQLYWVIPYSVDTQPIYAKFIGYEGVVAEFTNPEIHSSLFNVKEIKIN